MALAGLVQWSLTRTRDTAVPAWFKRHFHWFVWGSTLLFGLAHLGNYEALTSPLGVLVVLPQTIGGLLLAYTRTRLGLGAAMAHHAAYNAVFLAGGLRLVVRAQTFTAVPLALTISIDPLAPITS